MIWDEMFFSFFMLCLSKENKYFMLEDVITYLPAGQLDACIAGMLRDVPHDRLFVLEDAVTARLCRPLLAGSLHDAACDDIIIAEGDDNKSVDALQQVWLALSRGGATRHSVLVNLGGGMVTDLGGFAASTFKRGIRFINIPTTLLAMVDASVGGKTGINFNGLKNEVGVFSDPLLTVIYLPFLASLPTAELRSGYAEMLKHALLDSQDHLSAVIGWDFDDVTSNAFLALVRRSVDVKTRVTQLDSHEQGLRKTLNFGHTVGHALEEMALAEGRPVPHGYAVAWGIVCELFISVALLDFPMTTFRQVASLVNEVYGKPALGCDDYDKVYELMQHDKKNKCGVINFVLLRDVGRAEIDCHADKSLVFESFDFLRDGL